MIVKGTANVIVKKTNSFPSKLNVSVIVDMIYNNFPKGFTYKVFTTVVAFYNEPLNIENTWFCGVNMKLMPLNLLRCEKILAIFYFINPIFTLIYDL